MTETFQNTFEGGSNTTTVSTVNSGGASGDAFTAVSGSPTFTSTSPLDGTLSVLYTATATQFVAWDAAAAWADFAYYFYFDFPSNPVTSSHMLVAWRSLSAALGNIILTTSGELTANSGTGGSSTSTPTAGLTASTRYRVEGQCTGWGGASSTHALQVYSGTSLTAISSVTASGGTTASGVQRVRWGRPNGTTTLATGMRMDTLKVVFGDATAISPVGPGGRPHIFRTTIAQRPRQLWSPRRARFIDLAQPRALGAFSADVAGTTAGGGSVTGLVGVVAAVTGPVTAGGTVTAQVGVAGLVTGTTTAGGTVTAAVARFSTATGTTTTGGTVAGTAGVIGTVTGPVTAGGTVTALVARTAAVTGTTTAGGTVIASTVTGLLADVAGTTTAGGTVTAALAATSGTSGTTTAGGTVAGGVNANGSVTGTTVGGGTVTAGTISSVTGTTVADGIVSGQVAATGATSATITAGGTVTAAVGKLAAVTGTTSVGAVVARQLGTALVVTGSTVSGGTVTAQVACFASVAGTTVAGGEVSFGAPTIGQIHQGNRITGGPQVGRRPVGGPRATIRS